jgi:hypothetical protein
VKVFAKSPFVGLCAAAVVLVVCWSAGLVTHVIYKPPPSSRPSPVAPSDDDSTVQTSEDIVAVTATVTAPPW